MSKRRTGKSARGPRQRAPGTRDDPTDARVASGVNRVLGARWVDKSIALVALLPFAYQAGEAVRGGDLDVPRLALIFQLAVIVLTMALRRPPVRVTTNPFFWVLAFFATYWTFLCRPFYELGSPLGPAWLASGVSVSALAVGIWARLSLGRNIGFVPAERAIVTTGAYAYVRHPIYSGIFVGILATELDDFSWRNLAIDTLWSLLWVAKTFIEERFLRQSTGYARYMEKVRWRWFPGIG